MWLARLPEVLVMAINYLYTSSIYFLWYPEKQLVCWD